MRLPRSIALPTRVISTFLVVALSGTLAFAAGGYNQLQSSPSRISFGAVELSQSLTQSVTLTNAGKTTISVSSISTSVPGISTTGLTFPASVAAGQSVVLNITFRPSTAGFVTGEVTVTTNASNPSLQIGIHANGVSSVPLTGSPSSVSFGQITVGSKSILPVVLSNPSFGKVVLTTYQVSGGGYSLSGPALPLTLRRGESATLNVTFAPLVAGTSNGSLSLPGAGLTIPLTGSGSGTTTGQLTISPASLAFGSIDVGSTNTQSSTLTASGGAVTVSSASSSSSQFAISGASFPLTLNAGQSANLTVTYSPSAAGAVSATVTLSSNASNGTAKESLSGTGLSPQYTVNLSWNASTSQVSGYNVYRGTVSGVYTKINSTLDPATIYADTSVVSGKTYYYAATSVNSSGQESTYSSPIQVAVP